MVRMVICQNQRGIFHNLKQYYIHCGVRVSSTEIKIISTYTKIKRNRNQK